MHLTQEQQEMLDGKYGEGTIYTMKIQMAIGNLLAPPSFCLSYFKSHDME